MKIWMTSEAMADVSDLIRGPRNKIEETINKILEKIKLPDMEWAVVLISLPNEKEKFFPEIVKKSKGSGSNETCLEFRLQISHAKILLASQLELGEIIFNCLSRSIELMSNLKVEEETQSILRTVLSEARVEFEKSRNAS